MGKFKTQRMKDKKKAQKLAQAVLPPAPGVQAWPSDRTYVDDDLEFEAHVEDAAAFDDGDEGLDFGDIPVGQRPGDWEEQLRAAGLSEDWIDAYRPPAPEAPAPPDGKEKVPPWKHEMCNRFRLEWMQGEEARQNLYDHVLDGNLDKDTPIEEDEVSPYVREPDGTIVRAAACNWCSDPVLVAVTGAHRGAQW